MPPARSNAARSVPPRTASARAASARSAPARPGTARAATARTAGAARTAPAPRTAPRRRSAPGFAPRRVKSRAPLSRIRWDRASRAGLVVVLVIIGYLGISGIVSLVHSHAQAEQGLSQVHRLAVTNRQLRELQESLHQKSTILSQARSLGMVKAGEQSFIYTK